MGKTTFTLELNKFVMQNKIFIYGKCNYFKSDSYSALIESAKMLNIITLEDNSTR